MANIKGKDSGGLVAGLTLGQGVVAFRRTSPRNTAVRSAELLLVEACLLFLYFIFVFLVFVIIIGGLGVANFFTNGTIGNKMI